MIPGVFARQGGGSIDAASAAALSDMLLYGLPSALQPYIVPYQMSRACSTFLSYHSRASLRSSGNASLNNLSASAVVAGTSPNQARIKAVTLL